MIGAICRVINRNIPSDFLENTSVLLVQDISKTILSFKEKEYLGW